MFFVICLVRFEHAIEPGKKLVSTMIGVQYDGAATRMNKDSGGTITNCSHAVSFGNGSDVVGSGYCTGDRSLLLVIREALSGKVCSSSLGNLEDNRGFDVSIYEISF